MTNNIPYMMSNDGNVESMTLFLSGVPRTVTSTHPSYAAIKENLDTLSVREVRELLDVKKAMANQLKHFGSISVDQNSGEVMYKGEVVHSQLATRMLTMLEDGYDIRPWALFMENLMQNPAKHAVDELYLWLERSGMPITERGNFLAYKKVQDDYTSFHRNPDGTAFRNDIGSFVQMPRNKVCDDRNRTCSSGLHFCSWDYLGSYFGSSGKVVLVEVNPAHVVSIPSDYNNAKGRAEGYLIVGEIPQEECEHAFPAPFTSYHDSTWITWEQDGDIDYSSIEDDWYEDYERDESEEEIEEAYNEGFEDGKDAFYSGNDCDPEYFFRNSFVGWDYEGEYTDGFYDGWYNAEVDKINEEENVVEDEDNDDAFIDELRGLGITVLTEEDLLSPQTYAELLNETVMVERKTDAEEAYEAGHIKGSDDFQWTATFDPSSPYHSIDLSIEFQRGYIDGYSERMNEERERLANSPVHQGAEQLRQTFRDLL